jgi:H+/Cl- antiporter ClcA
MVVLRQRFGLKFDVRSAIVAGGAAGLAAAFNTPLAGVTFAIEELSSDFFSAIKDYVLMAIIVASLAAISLTGDYTYFGKLVAPMQVPILSVLLIGITGGLLGALFSTALIQGNKQFARLRETRYGAMVPILLSLVLLAIMFIGGSEMLGPGNRVAQKLIQGELRADVVTFPFSKMAATLVTYWSGIAGGIFAPCLAIGSSLGAAIGNWMGIAVASCALIGMAAFLSGTIQAPMTAFVIIFEMTGHHQMLVPVMLASLIAFMTARLLKAKHLYQSLAGNYEALIRDKT